MKKILSMLTTVITAVIMLLGMAGCGWRDRMYPEYESGYFKYAVGTYKNGKQDAFLMGLTELGKQQTELILPKEIEGIPIKGLGYQIGQGWYSVEGRASFVSEQLKKLYVPFSLDNWGSFHEHFDRNCMIVQWSNLVGSFWESGGRIVGYNIFEDCYPEFVFYGGDSLENKIANISYLYNSKTTGEDDFYWVDSYDNDIITFIPPDPVREGYQFKGWYKEAECLNEWDFATDKTGEEIPIDEDSKPEDYDDSGITYLYAKWEKE